MMLRAVSLEGTVVLRYDGNLRPRLELQVVKFKSMTVRQKFGQNGNEACTATLR